MSKKLSVFNEKCPSHNVLAGIGDKWSILVMSSVLGKTCRFGELKRGVGGISAKVLTQTLRKLEKYGFITREPFSVLPMKVEYSLASLGQELSVILHSLTEWTESHMNKIMESKQNFLKK